MKRRHREINIFNMALLDILCGALGAFCFMMLALLPFYRPSPPPARAAERAEVQALKQEAEKLERELGEARAKRLDSAVSDLARDNERLRGELQAVRRDLARQEPVAPSRIGGARAVDVALKVDLTRSDTCEYDHKVMGLGPSNRIVTRPGLVLLLDLAPGQYTFIYSHTKGPACTITGTFLSTTGSRGQMPEVRLTRPGERHVVAFSVTADGRVTVK